MGRVEKVSVTLKKEISNIIHDELKDPRIGFVTVTRIEMSKDLQHAKIFFSVLGKEKEQKETKKALENASGFVRWLVAQRMQFRFVPEIRFVLDKSCEYSVHIQEELDKIKELYGHKKSHRTNKEK